MVNNFDRSAQIRRKDRSRASGPFDQSDSLQHWPACYRNKITLPLRGIGGLWVSHPLLGLGVCGSVGLPSASRLGSPGVPAAITLSVIPARTLSADPVTAMTGSAGTTVRRAAGDPSRRRAFVRHAPCHRNRPVFSRVYVRELRRLLFAACVVRAHTRRHKPNGHSKLVTVYSA
eukprot:1194835-Prorocentrum_minimum.AAC.5